MEHIGIASQEEGDGGLFEKLLGRKMYKTEDVDSEKVRTRFFKVGESKLELLNGLNETDAITTFIEKRGPGIHHIAFEVEDIHHAFDEAKRLGFRVINEKPKRGADNKLIFFLHPKSTGGVLVELCQEIKQG